MGAGKKSDDSLGLSVRLVEGPVAEAWRIGVDVAALDVREGRRRTVGAATGSCFLDWLDTRGSCTIETVLPRRDVL